jgi:protein involved in polysaccharide export with SLBB domain
VIGLLALAPLSACTFLPGMTAHYYKSAIVMESPEQPNQMDYTLVAVTPLLVQQMTEERDALRKKEVGTAPFSDAEPKPYRLGNFDVLRIFVWGNPEFSPVLNMAGTAGTASTPVGRNINEKGEVFFPLVGTIKASGLTISEFREELTKRLSKFVKDPQIDVDVSAFRSQRVYVAGEVRSNSYLQITDQPLRILDAIGQAGGLTPTADIYNVKLTRGKVIASIDLERAYYAGDTSANIVLQAGDIRAENAVSALRSEAMQEAAADNAAKIIGSQVGVWKVGENHIPQIAQDKQGNAYDLLTKAEFNAGFNDWRAKIARRSEGLEENWDRLNQIALTINQPEAQQIIEEKRIINIEERKLEKYEVVSANKNKILESTELVKQCFEKQDIAVAVFERQFGLQPNAAKSFIKNISVKHINLDKKSIQLEAKKLNRYFATISPDYLNQDSIKDLLFE